MVSNLYHMREEKLIIRKGTIFDVLVHSNLCVINCCLANCLDNDYMFKDLTEIHCSCVVYIKSRQLIKI
jgi:hypothetical protein